MSKSPSADLVRRIELVEINHSVSTSHGGTMIEPMRSVATRRVEISVGRVAEVATSEVVGP
nr:hypothetical protein ISGA_2403 [Gordonia sp. NB41Y]